MEQTIQPSRGRLAVLMPGLGAVATTLIAGVVSVRHQLAEPVGSLTQMGRMPGEDGRPVRIAEAVPLASLDQLVFGGWDIYPDNVYEAARKAAVLEDAPLRAIRGELEQIRPMPAVFDPAFVPNLHGRHVKSGKNKAALARALMDDIAGFIEANGCERAVMVWCASTEVYTQASLVHQDIDAFEQGLEDDDPAIAPSMLYAYAAIRSGVPFLNGAPNLACDVPALVQLAQRCGVPIGGKDFKTGQTLMKTILAPGLQARALGIRGWYSTNILGNRDGYVLDNPENFRTKEVSKLGVLEDILRPDLDPDLYGDMHHQVRINYYPPHGDNKESWDNIDIFGWLGYRMQIKINFLCRDSILAAPVALDLALLGDLASRAGMAGVQEWLSFYFKSPQVTGGERPEHDVFRQLARLHEVLRAIAGRPLAADDAGVDPARVHAATT